jgi:predicted transcriptional regulator
MAMTLRLNEEQTEALRRRAEKEGRSMQQVALGALDDYLVRAEDDELSEWAK